MNKIITIYDKNYNGKTGKKIYEEYCLGSCILNFENNTRINFMNINYNIENNNFYYKEDLIDFKKIDIVIFNYAEDNVLSRKYIKKTNNLYIKLKLHFPHLKFFNIPLNHDLMSNKFITYKIIKKKNYKYLKIPLFNKLIKKTIKKKYFPIIVSLKKQAGGKGKFLVNNYTELMEHMNKCDLKFWAKFYKSYFPKTNIFICIRIFIFCNKLIDFVLRPSNDWNVHTGNQLLNSNKIKNMNDYFDKYFEMNKVYIQNIIDELYDLCGDGLYCHDFIFVDNKLILCELGYKTLDPKLIMFYDKNNVISNKIITNQYKVKELYKNLLLNFK